MSENRKSFIAAALILLGFGLVFYFMPRIMVTLGEISTIAAGMVAALCVAAFFLVFWLRGRSQRNRN